MSACRRINLLYPLLGAANTVQIAAVANQERQQSKFNGHANTSQYGNWQNFRNAEYDREVRSVGSDRLFAKKNNGATNVVSVVHNLTDYMYSTRLPATCFTSIMTVFSQNFPFKPRDRFRFSGQARFLEIKHHNTLNAPTTEPSQVIEH